MVELLLIGFGDCILTAWASGCWRHL